MQNFSGCRTRHVLFGNKRYRSRPLVTGDAVLAPFDDFLGSGHFTVPRNDDGVNAFAPLFVGNANDCDVLDLRVTADQRLHFRRINILATRNDHVALAIDQENVAIFVAAGYASVWLLFSFAASGVQVVFTRAVLLDAGVASTSGFLAGTILICAGAYQFSALKHACLRRCQHPFPFFFTNWTTTRGGLFRLGIKQGLYCLGCCWAMMLVMLAVGVMNVAWMAGLAAVITIEKLQNGRRFTQAVGVALIAIGTGIAMSVVAAHWIR